jgi:hypothetical protein
MMMTYEGVAAVCTKLVNFSLDFFFSFMGRVRGARTVQAVVAKENKDDKKENDRGRRSLVAEDAESEGALALPVGLGLFAIVLTTYTQTAYPTVPGGDAGELVFTSCSLGIAHPPGMVCPGSSDCNAI